MSSQRTGRKEQAKRHAKEDYKAMRERRRIWEEDAVADDIHQTTIGLGQ